MKLVAWKYFSVVMALMLALGLGAGALTPGPVIAADPLQQWVMRYNGTSNGSDTATDIAVDGSGNAYVTGRSYNGTNNDYCTVKYSPGGDKLWDSKYNGTANGSDTATDIAVDGSGNAYVTGYSYNGANSDYATIKYGQPQPEVEQNPWIGMGAPTSHSSSVVVPTTPAPPVTNPIILTSSASLSAKSVTPGTPVTVTADIINKSTVNGSKKVTLYVNGQVETTQAVTVNSGGSSKLTFSVSRSEPGDYSVYVDGVPAGSFKVELFSGNDAILMFSAILIAMAFLIGMVMLWRRQRAGRGNLIV